MLLVHAGQTGYAGAYPAYPVPPPLHMTMIINMDTRTINVNKRPEKIYSA